MIQKQGLFRYPRSKRQPKDTVRATTKPGSTSRQFSRQPGRERRLNMELGAASTAPSLLPIQATSWPRSIGVPVALLTPIWTPPRGNLWVTVSVSEPSWYGASGTCGTWNRRISADRRRHDRGGARVLDHLAKNQLHWFLFSEKNRSGDSRMNSPPNAHMLSTCLWIVFDDSSDAARCSRTGRNSPTSR